MTETKTWFITGAGRGMGTDIANPQDAEAAVQAAVDRVDRPVTQRAHARCTGHDQAGRAAHAAGRDPGEVRRIYNMPGAFTAAAPAAE